MSARPAFPLAYTQSPPQIEKGYTVDEKKGTYIPIPAEEMDALEPVIVKKMD